MDSETHIIIRFSLPLPDLPLVIPHDPSNSPSDPHPHDQDYPGDPPQGTRTLIRHLKSAIRAHLPSDHADRALRLIHNGRILDDGADVFRAVGTRAQPSPAPRGTILGNTWGNDSVRGAREEQDSRPTAKSKGKSPLHPTGIARDESSNGGRKQNSIYIHASISPTTLTPAQLAAESAPAPTSPSSSPSSPTFNRDFKSRTSYASTTAAPQGFDRLLASGGFTAEDVAGLRAQFREIVAARHTPDTMPDGATLWGMEERWLDEESFGPTSGGGAGARSNGGAGGREGQTVDEEEGAAMWDTLLGVMSGFFWPLGALCWGLRGEGIWSRRRGLAVLAGVGVNVGFGLVRVLS